MIYKPFQKIKLSWLGMGNMRLPVVGEDPNGSIDEGKAQDIIDYAMKCGVNYYDTAYIYHNGESESFLGKALSKYPRASYYLATKFYIDANPDYRAVFEEQLQKLQTSHIDFYLIHSLTDENIDRYIDCGCLDYFEEQQKNGRITYLGFSSHASPITLKRMAEVRNWDFAQIQMNYLDWEFSTTREEYEILTQRRIPVMVMESVRGGKLADLGSNLNLRLKSQKEEWSIPSWALRWLKAKANVQVILSGMSSLEQIEDNAAVFETNEGVTKEQEQVLAQIAKDLKASLSVPCTACRYCCGECPKGLEIPKLMTMIIIRELELVY